MINNLTLVGRLTDTPLMNYTESDRKYTKITLAITRNFKNCNGEYETDFIDCILWTVNADKVCEYCRKGDILGIRGRLQTKYNDNNQRYLVVVADTVTFISSGK